MHVVHTGIPPSGVSVCEHMKTNFTHHLPCFLPPKQEIARVASSTFLFLTTSSEKLECTARKDFRAAHRPEPGGNRVSTHKG